MASFRLFSVSKPEYVLVDISTEVTDEDLAEAIEDEYGVKYSKDGKRLLDAQTCQCFEYHIRKGTLCICGGAFVGCRILCVEIPESVIRIGEMAFAFCDDLTNVLIPRGVLDIGEFAFEGCFSLTGIKIPNSVTKIDADAFNGCSGLADIKIPDSVAEIGAAAFSRCSGLTNISVSESNPSYASRNNCCLSKDLKTLIFGCISSLVPDGVTIIEDYSFDGCFGLTSMEIPASVSEIGDYAFSGCSGLTGIKIPGCVTRIGKSAFYGCNLPESVKKELAVKFGSFIFDEYYK